MAVASTTGPADDIDALDISEDLKDERLLNAITNAYTSQTITPLIKEELRCTILSRRHAQGKDEIKIEEKKPNIKKVFTEQEKQRKLRRQEQNRRAARKCRQKKKEIETTVLEEYSAQKDIQNKLNEEIRQLNKEKNEIEKILKSHHSVCTMLVNGGCRDRKPMDISCHNYVIDSNDNQSYPNVSFQHTPISLTTPTDALSPITGGLMSCSDGVIGVNADQPQDSPEINQSVEGDCCGNFDLPSTNKFQDHPYAETLLCPDTNSFHEHERKVSESSYFSETDIDDVDEIFYTDVDKIPDNYDTGFAPDYTHVRRRQTESLSSLSSETDYLTSDRLQNFHRSQNFSIEHDRYQPIESYHTRDCMYSASSMYNTDETNEDEDLVFQDQEVTSFMKMLMESEMDTRRNPEGRGVSCSSLEEYEMNKSIDFVPLLQTNLIDDARFVEDSDQPVFVDSKPR